MSEINNITEEKASEIFSKKNRFTSEKAMCKYIEQHIREFCIEVLGDDYISHKREHRLSWSLGTFHKGAPNVRLDFLIVCKNNVYAIEVKNPTQAYTEMSRSISQIMLYKMLLEKSGKKHELIMLSSVHSGIYTEMLKYYNLDIRYILFNNNSHAELLGYCDD